MVHFLQFWKKESTIKPTTAGPITTTSDGEVTTGGTVSPGCTEHGRHHLGESPNWWQEGSDYKYTGYIDIPIQGEVDGPVWSHTVTFTKPVSRLVFG